MAGRTLARARRRSRPSRSTAAWSPTTSSAATARRDRDAAPRRRARARGPALAVPRRAGVRRPARLRRLADRLPRPRRRPARRGGRRPARTAGSPSRRSTAPRAPKPSSWCCSRCEEQLLPSWRALESPDPEDLAEERRLFYVAATRAKDRLVITRAHVRGGRTDRRPVALPRRGRPRHARRGRSPPDPPTPLPKEPDHVHPRHPGDDRACAHPPAGDRAVPAAVRARRDRLSRHDQGRLRRRPVGRRPGRRLPRTPSR